MATGESPNPEISEVARQLGSRGGQKTAERLKNGDPDYYKRLNRLSYAAKQKKKQLEN